MLERTDSIRKLAPDVVPCEIQLAELAPKPRQLDLWRYGPAHPVAREGNFRHRVPVRAANAEPATLVLLRVPVVGHLPRVIKVGTRAEIERCQPIPLEPVELVQLVEVLGVPKPQECFVGVRTFVGEAGDERGRLFHVVLEIHLQIRIFGQDGCAGGNGCGRRREGSAGDHRSRPGHWIAGWNVCFGVSRIKYEIGTVIETFVAAVFFAQHVRGINIVLAISPERVEASVRPQCTYFMRHISSLEFINMEV
mmetsp:Transcript_1265/g.2740  ORF Transcript_1265/g.2740 Transcript_1265/m.2740 type:complete len:251 (+) Transcript_1265:287-1039(+)